MKISLNLDVTHVHLKDKSVLCLTSDRGITEKEYTNIAGFFKQSFPGVHFVYFPPNFKVSETLPKGYPTSTKDINGKTICVGDKIRYIDEEAEVNHISEVIFKRNAFRKRYLDPEVWDETLIEIPLELNYELPTLKYEIVGEKDVCDGKS